MLVSVLVAADARAFGGTLALGVVALPHEAIQRVCAIDLSASGRAGV